jgi:hypothetical protein
MVYLNLAIVFLGMGLILVSIGHGSARINTDQVFSWPGATVNKK